MNQNTRARASHSKRRESVLRVSRDTCISSTLFFLTLKTTSGVYIQTTKNYLSINSQRGSDENITVPFLWFQFSLLLFEILQLSRSKSPFLLFIEVLGASAVILALWVLTGILAYESILRLLPVHAGHHSPVNSDVMILTAALAFGANIV